MVTTRRATAVVFTLFLSCFTSLTTAASCRTISVVSGDGCASLASRCGISGATFTTYNPTPNLCATLAVGQKVCCSAGGLPVPTQNADGSCASYTVVSGDTCTVIALSNSITVADLEARNKQTWGWGGCSRLQAQQSICLSTGTPPMPAPVQGTVCGPQVPGTQKPPAGTSLASLNPCPLKACCNVWGQCGTTAEFCTNTTTGAPGTAAPGTNGCISNCGTDIIKSSPPAQFRHVAYFEAFNIDRPCLTMDVQQIDKSKYTHIHFAFLDLTPDFNVDIIRYRDQFNRFVKMTGIKRIPSFGGWAMSTEPATYNIFRDAVTAANRQTFVNNLVNFVNQWGLDGIDIDWEYPGAQDIPEIPPGSLNDGANLAATLALLKTRLGASKSVSIATPASYWYLKGFPITTMISSLDYIVYMTYDIHGQWDYGNKWSQQGCPDGNCLRSHVNLTETTNALSMITKAGVPSNKLLIGITSYGRSFKMTTPGCTGPMCTYTGKASGAKPGRCTKTAGYISNAEINEIKAKNSNVQSLYDAASDSDIVVYDGTEWMAYMTDTTKNRRIGVYQGLNMGGVSDWAVDLQAFVSPPTPTIPSQPTAPAQSGGFTDPVSANGKINPYLKNCNDAETAMIQQAWSEAADLAAAHYEWWPGSTYQDAMTMYLGKNSKNDHSFVTGKGPLYMNIEREYLIHWGWRIIQPPNTAYVYFYCREEDIPDKQKEDPLWRPMCTDKNGNPTDNTAYAFNDIGLIWQAHYVVFCPQFFSNQLTSLATKVLTAQGDIYMQETIDYWRPIRARTMFHETYHWEYTVSEPLAIDYAYDPQAIVDLAISDEEEAAENAESFALAAMAIYLQKTFNLPEPPKPKGSRGTIAGANLREVHLASPPPGWKRPVAADAAQFRPDMTGVKMLEQAGPLNSGSAPPCKNGLWQGENACLTFCLSGNCAKSSSNATWVCSGCGGGTPVCVEGSYANFDACHDRCHEGMCIENAGQAGVQCQLCP